MDIFNNLQNLSDLQFFVLLVLIAPVLFLQNMAFTWVSRSRNGGDVGYHRYAAWCSNGIWYVTQLFILSTVIPALITGDLWRIIMTAIVYIVATTEGSCFMMARLLKTEKGKRQVGAR